MASTTMHAGLITLALLAVSVSATAQAPANPLWQQHKTKNYLPEMTWPEVADLLTRTDMVIMPVTAIEEHGKIGRAHV